MTIEIQFRYNYMEDKGMSIAHLVIAECEKLFEKNNDKLKMIVKLFINYC